MTDKRNDILQGKFQDRRGIRDKEKLNEVPFKSFEKSDDDNLIAASKTFGNTTGRRKDRSRVRQLNNRGSGGDKILMMEESSPEGTLNKIHLKFSKTTSQQNSQ